MKKILAIALVYIFAISLLAGCGGSPSETNMALAGKYTLTSMEMDGEDATPFFSELGMNTDDTYIEFLSGGKFNMKFVGEEAEGTFKVNGNTVTLTSEDEDLDIIIEGNRLIMGQEGDPESDVQQLKDGI